VINLQFYIYIYICLVPCYQNNVSNIWYTIKTFHSLMMSLPRTGNPLVARDQATVGCFDGGGNKNDLVLTLPWCCGYCPLDESLPGSIHDLPTRMKFSRAAGVTLSQHGSMELWAMHRGIWLSPCHGRSLLPFLKRCQGWNIWMWTIKDEQSTCH
jgi:hypothetical protein